MYKCKVIGYQKIDFKDQKTGNQVSGYNLFLISEPETTNITGTKCEKIFISSQYVDYTPALNDDIVILYNRYGKVSSIQTC